MVSNTITIFLSGCALVLSGISLGWNIYRDVIIKPRIKVLVDKATIHTVNGKAGAFLTIDAINFGPGVAHLRVIRGKKETFWNRLHSSIEYFAVIHDYKNPLSGQLPTTLEVGEKITLLLPWNEGNALSARPTHLGLSDTFGRMNWAKKKVLRKAQQKWDKEFLE
jgi:hypothetical protein